MLASLVFATLAEADTTIGITQMLTLKGYSTVTRVIGIWLTLFSPIWLSGVVILALLGLVHPENAPTEINGVRVFGFRHNAMRFIVEIVAMVVSVAGFFAFPFYPRATAQILAVSAGLVFVVSLIEPALRKK